MKALIQRVNRARVIVEEELIAQTARGLLVFLGVSKSDGIDEVEEIIDTLLHLRILADDEGKMNHSIIQQGGDILVVPEFTLYADCSSGRRPSFGKAGGYQHAQGVYRRLVENLSERSPGKVESGKFGAHMKVELENDGPVTLMIET
ncbi:MAG: D-aminoacyl-tRNA deacylase [Candidatus Bipolaricaulota bacterium]